MVSRPLYVTEYKQTSLYCQSLRAVVRFTRHTGGQAAYFSLPSVWLQLSIADRIVNSSSYLHDML